MKRVTLKQVNKEIQKEYPEVEMVYSPERYYYLYGTSEKWGLIISGYSDGTIVDVAPLNRCPLSYWVETAKSMLKKMECESN